MSVSNFYIFYFLYESFYVAMIVLELSMETSWPDLRRLSASASHALRSKACVTATVPSFIYSFLTLGWFLSQDLSHTSFFTVTLYTSFLWSHLGDKRLKRVRCVQVC